MLMNSSEPNVEVRKVVFEGKEVRLGITKASKELLDGFSGEIQDKICKEVVKNMIKDQDKLKEIRDYINDYLKENEI